MRDSARANTAGIASLLFILMCLMVAFPLRAFAANGDATSVLVDVNYGQTEARTMLQMINDFRQGNDAWAWNESDTEQVRYDNLSALAYDYDLEQIAMQRAAEIALRYSHQRPDSSDWHTLSYNGHTSYGENIAAGQTTAAQVFESWQETNEPYSGQGHRRNMLSSNFTAVGVGHVIANGTHYWVQEFSMTPYSATVTEAADGASAVSVDVAPSLVNSAEIYADENPNMVIASNGSRKLPALPASLAMVNRYPENATCPVSVCVDDWSVANEGVARIEGDSLVAVSPGQTTLSGTAKLGNQSVAVTINVEVVAGDTIEAAEVTLSGATGLAFDGLAKTPAVESVTYGGETLSEGTDYSVSYSDNVYPGHNAKVVITGLGRFAGTEQVIAFSIGGASLGFLCNSPGFSFGYSGYTSHYYDGTQQIQHYLLKANGTPLREGVDYTLEFANNVNVGEANVTIVGAGLFSGALTTDFAILQTNLSSCTIDSIGDCTYTGQAIEPEVVVRRNGNILPKSDYTVAYSDNVEIGTGKVTITAASGNVSGSAGTTFNIAGVNLGTANLEITGLNSAVYTGSEIKPVPTVKLDGVSLVAGTDFDLSYANNINAGTATVTITGKGRYGGAVSREFTITSKPLDSSMVSLDTSEFVYNGATQGPTVTVSDNGFLTASDYAIDVDTAVSKGDYHVRVTGKGNYQGIVEKDFSIAPCPLTNDMIGFSAASFVYNGSTQKPTVTVALGNQELIEGMDYALVNAGGVNKGSYTVKATAVTEGNYSGSAERSFEITAKPVTSSMIQISDYVYTGHAIVPEVTVNDGGRTVSYNVVANSGGTNVGRYSVTVEGTGNYSGEASAEYSITQKDIASQGVVVAGGFATYTGERIEPAATVTDGDTQLGSGDYSVSYDSDGGVDKGTYDITITGKGNYQGTRTAQFVIEPLAITDSSISVADIDEQTADSDVDTPEPAVTVTRAGKPLAQGVDYSVAYSRDPGAGVAMVTITGTGNYSGTRTQTFDVVARDLYDARESLRSKVAELESSDLTKYSESDKAAIQQAIANANQLLGGGGSVEEFENCLASLQEAERAAISNYEASVSGGNNPEPDPGTNPGGNSGVNPGANPGTNEGANPNTNLDAPSTLPLEATTLEPAEIVDLPAVKIAKLKAGKKSATVTWKKIAKRNQKKIQGIEIQYSTDNFATIAGTKYAKKTKTSLKLKKLTSKKKYKVRIRAYRNAADGKHVSPWKTKSVKVK